MCVPYIETFIINHRPLFIPVDGISRGFFVPHKRQRKRMRLAGYDYSQDGYYIVTICVWGHSMWFGNIKNAKTKLSIIGKIVDHCWLQIPQHFMNVKLDEYVIMPNHVHGIIIINGHVGDAHVRPLHIDDRTNMLLSKTIHGFKSSVTRLANKTSKNIHFQWQRSFYDHIIRNDQSLYDARKYIRNNTANWQFDRNHPDNL